MKRVIKLTKDGKEELFTSLVAMYDKHPGLRAINSKIVNSLSRRKMAYNDSCIKIERTIVQ